MLLFTVSHSAKAATCLDVFPSAINGSLLGSGNELINIPTFTGADWYMNEVQTIPLGDSQYYSWYSQQTVIVNPIPVSETSARLYISGGVNWVNAKINVGGNPEDLIIITSGSITISGGETEINAIIYSLGAITVYGSATINGAVAAAGSINIVPPAVINYDENAIENADFNGMCDGAVVPIANYQFDECSYTGAAFEVIDQIGSYHATAFGSVDTNNNGQIERFVDISSGSHHIETSIPLPADFSVSTWFKKPTSISGNPIFVLGAMQNGGDLLYIDRSNNWRWGIYNSITGSLNGTFSFTTLDNNWHHMALVYSGGRSQLYIDGVLVDAVNSVPVGTLKYIGSSFDEINGSNPQGFRAPLDEFLVYDIALSAVDILAIYDNQLARNNYDGSSRAPVSCSTLLALYRFEQTDFTTKIDDTSGLNNHAENIFGGLSTENGKYCRGFESESWNDYNDITDAFRSSLDVNDDIGLQGTISFWFNSRIDWDQGQERVLFDASIANSASDKYFVLEIQQDGRLKFAFEDSADSDFYIIEPSTNRAADTWYYLTVTWDYTSDSFAIYVDGTLQIQQSRNTNGAMGELNQIVFGDNASNYTLTGNSNIASPYSSRGNYDEVRIYNKVLTLSEIQSDMNENFGCNTIDHFEIDTLNGQGLTCEADIVTLRACSDASCSLLNTDAVDVVLTVSDAGGVVLNKTVTVVGGEVSVDYIHTIAEVVTLSLDQTFECINGMPTDCDVTFADSGFIFSAIPTQISGKSSGEGFDATILTLQAVETDNNTGACIGAFPDGGDIPVNLSYSCTDGTCTQAVVLTNNNNAYNVTAASALHSLRFTSDSTASFSINYPDAAKLMLNAQKNIEVEDSDGNKVIKDLSGVSNAFVERPFGFYINVLNNPKATSASGDAFNKASEDFTVQLKAVVWQSADDGNNDGVPDIGADLSDNTVTANFGKEGSPEKAKVIHALVAPMPGELGNFTISNEFIFTDGITSDSEVRYSEVGIISLTANLLDNSYLGVSDVQGNAPYVGRFYPDHFVQTIVDGNQGSLIANHDSDLALSCFMLDWVYTGQLTEAEGSIGYLNEPILTITAYNGASPDAEVTKNYSGDFAKLAFLNVDTENKITFSQPLTTHVNSLPLTGDVSDIGTILVIGDGVLTYQLSELHDFVYTRNSASEVIPFDASFELPFNEFKDSDKVTFKLSSGGTDYFENPYFYQLDATPPATDFNNTVEVRFGRGYLANSYGPETSDLPLHLSAQYLDEHSNFITNSDDVCTSYTSTNITLTTIDFDDAVVGVNSVTGQLDSGETREVKVTKPSDGSRGGICVEYAILPWLQYKWAIDEDNLQCAYTAGDVDNLFNDNPFSIATFGIYRGNDRIIYQREIAK